MLSIRNKARFMSVITILAMLFSFANVSPATAQEATPPNLPGWTMGTGTHFELLDSPYLPVTLDSSVSVTLVLSSVPEIVDVTIDADASAGSADFTVGGFAPNTLYYHYVDEGLNPVTFTTDDTGSFTFTQDLSESHHVWFRAHPSTKYLYDNATGGDCSVSLGTWSSATKTCTLTHNVNDAIFIQNNGITLDGAGYQLSAPGNYAVYSHGFSNVTVKNLKIVNSAYGIRLENSSNNTVKDNTVTGPSGYYYGIVVYNSANNSTVTGNSVSGAYYYGIVAGYLYSSNNIISGNTVSNNQYGMFFGYYSNNNQVYNNNFVNNTYPFLYGGTGYGGTGNIFNKAAPVGGNYFSNFHTPAQGCNDANSDGFCDAPYLFNYYGDSGQDNLPWTTQDGWATPADAIAPTASPTQSPAANGTGWNNSDVTVTWNWTDNSSGSGIDNANCTTSTLSSGEGNMTLNATCKDLAGNTGTASYDVKVDKTNPAISASATKADTTAYAAGTWTNQTVTVHFICSDTSGSGVASCPADAVFSSDGVTASVSGTATDNADNSAGASFGSIKIDKTLPTVSLVGGPANSGSYYFGSVPAAPTCSASDALSGLNGSCAVSGYSALVGSQTVTAAANDNAGNQNSASSAYTVLAWTTNGFFQPVDMGGVWNTVKNGSTVPLKFEVFAGSTELTSTSIVNQPLTATQTLCTGGTTDDIELLASGTTSLRYDATAGQFIYNWQTPKKAGYCYVVTVKLADGSTISANFKLK